MGTSRWMLGLAAAACFAAPAFAESLEDRVARVERDLAARSAPSSREIQSAVDAYLATSQADATLVGGPGQAGYDGGFWIRGGTFLLKINLTLQARYEYFDWDDSEWEPSPGGDLSGFSLPRATLKFSGDATCDVHYYVDLEFGHFIGNAYRLEAVPVSSQALIRGEGYLYDGPPIVEEAWIEYEAAPAAVFRMGLVRTAATRQLMTDPEHQQFVDISLASGVIGVLVPGFIDRNTDYGVMLHGVLGCDGQFSYLATVTNGEGVGYRSVLDGYTTDNLAYSGRVNWDFLGHMGYEEGALRQRCGEWTGAFGAWAHYFAEAWQHRPYDKYADRLTWGVDLALGWGGFSLTAAYSMAEFDGDGFDTSYATYLAQIGYLFPGTAWEVAARYSGYQGDDDADGIGAYEYAFAVNYYIDGHADKVTLDVSFLTADDFNDFWIWLPGYNWTGESDAMLLRLQWQLAL